MFDPNQFDKNVKQIQKELQNISDTAINSIHNAFANLPSKMKEAFQTGEMEKMMKIAASLGDKFKDINEQLKKTKEYNSYINDRITLQNQWLAGLQKERAEMLKHQKELKDLQKAGAHFDEELKKISTSLGQNTRAQNTLIAATNAYQTTLSGVIKKQGILAQILQNTSLEGKTLGSILKDIVLVAINQLAKGYLALRAAGFDAAQTVGQTFTVAGSQISGVMHGVLGSTADYAAALGSVANQLGTLAVPESTIIETVRLTKQFGLASDISGHLIGQLTRMSNYSETVAANAVKLAIGFAKANNVAPGQVLKDMAANSEILATYAGRGAAAFERGAIAARQQGVNLQSMSAFADRLVNDFEGSLKLQAEVQTILPGMNFSAIQYAAQFGTDEDVIRATKSALQASGVSSLDQLPRSVRNKLVSSLGLSKEEVQNLLGTGGPGGVKGAVNFNETAEAFQNAFGDIGAKLLSSNALLIGAILANTAALLFKGGGALGGLVGGALGGLGSIFSLGGESVLGKLAARVGGEGLAGNLPVIGPIIAGLTGFGMGMAGGEGFGKSAFRGVGAGLGALAPGMAGFGLSVGGDIAGGALYDSIFGHSTAVAGGGMTMPGAAVPAASEGVSAAAHHSNEAVIHLLQQILTATRDGKNIYIDGKKLSDSLVVAHSRG